MKFKVGDTPIHPHHGVTEIAAIESKEVAGVRKTFYTLKLTGSSVKVMVATDAASRVGMRHVMHPNDIDGIFDILRDHRPAVTGQPWNRRYRAYSEMLTSGSPQEVARVLRDLMLIQRIRPLSFGERSLFEKANRFLVRELAVAADTSDEAIESEMAKAFSDATSPPNQDARD